MDAGNSYRDNEIMEHEHLCQANYSEMLSYRSFPVRFVSVIHSTSSVTQRGAKHESQAASTVSVNNCL